MRLHRSRGSEILLFAPWSIAQITGVWPGVEGKTACLAEARQREGGSRVRGSRVRAKRNGPDEVRPVNGREVEVEGYSTVTAICFGFASSRCGSRMVSTPSL